MKELIDLLLPEGSNLGVNEMRVECGILTVAVWSKGGVADCPDCAQPSERVHSRRDRWIADLPWASWPVCLRVAVRRFFCDNEACSRKTFTESMPDLMDRYARRTHRLAQLQGEVGWAVGGQAGMRLLKRLQMPTSRDTVLRLIPDCPESEVKAPRVLGVDDWAWRKGQRYGTILVDLEQQMTIDLLPDRLADSLATWLQAHPGVEIISRDRAQAYIDGSTRGAPKAIQVADRWHLLQNLKDALKRLLDQHPACLYAAAQKPKPSAHQSKEGTSTQAAKTAENEPKSLTQAEKQKQQTRQHRLKRYERVVELAGQGYSMRAISREMGLGRQTVRRYLKAPAFPEMAKRTTGPGILEPYLPFLKQQLAAGPCKGSQLFQDIQAQGFEGSASTLRHWLSEQRKKRSNQTKTSAPSQPKKTRPWSANYAVWLMLKEPHQLAAEKHQALQRLLQASSVVRQAYNFGQSFVRMVRYRFSKALDLWLEAVIRYIVPELQGLAKSLRQDKKAVLAALTLPWSNGPVEGQVNRLKLIKREMYGRAKFKLLRRRVLAPQPVANDRLVEYQSLRQSSISINPPNIRILQSAHILTADDHSVDKALIRTPFMTPNYLTN